MNILFNKSCIQYISKIGWMAEWLCSGLQSRLRRFDSGFSLQKLLKISIHLKCIFKWYLLTCPSGGIGRHKGLKIPR